MFDPTKDLNEFKVLVWEYAGTGRYGLMSTNVKDSHKLLTFTIKSVSIWFSDRFYMFFAIKTLDNIFTMFLKAYPWFLKRSACLTLSFMASGIERNSNLNSWHQRQTPETTRPPLPCCGNIFAIVTTPCIVAPAGGHKGKHIHSDPYDYDV